MRVIVSNENGVAVVRQASAVKPSTEPFQWPLWAVTIALLKADTDAGVGDTVERIIGPIGGQAFKLWAAKLGVDCGCGARKADWNDRFQYQSRVIHGPLTALTSPPK